MAKKSKKAPAKKTGRFSKVSKQAKKPRKFAKKSTNALDIDQRLLAIQHKLLGKKSKKLTKEASIREKVFASILLRAKKIRDSLLPVSPRKNIK